MHSYIVKETLLTILWSLSPFGEAKVGIPYGMLNDLNPYFVFAIALGANILVFPLMMIFLDKINTPLLRWNWYKRSAIWVAKRAKKGSKKNFNKYGYLGLALFVMIPLPGTGVYVGSIATYLFKMERKKAFTANTIGITISSIIVWCVTFFGQGAF
ncbi:MAG: small multi-drug export protein [Aureisphaera sp.]